MRDYNWPRILKLIVKESLTDDRVERPIGKK